MSSESGFRLPHKPNNFLFSLKLYLPPMERSLHSLDVRRVLGFLQDKTKGSVKNDNPLWHTVLWEHGLPSSNQFTSRWFVVSVILCYRLANKHWLCKPWTHSVRGKVATTAFFINVPISEIFKVATKGSVYTSLHRLDSDSKTHIKMCVKEH